ERTQLLHICERANIASPLGISSPFKDFRDGFNDKSWCDRSSTTLQDPTRWSQSFREEDVRSLTRRKFPATMNPDGL
ncbi:MAG TPA: hypothetical protein VGI13_02400, partial [Candidatus Acidoferrum sp.]